jgi:hemerythrin
VAFAEWDPALETGNLMVDGQHRELFAAVNELHDAIHDHNDIAVLGGILYRLQRYTAVHFGDEEGLMADVAYPDLERHHGLHLQLAEQTSSLASKYLSGELTLGITLATFLRDWLTHHIGEEDRRLAEHIRATRPDLLSP